MPRRSRLIPGLLAAAVIATAGCTLPVIAPNESGPEGGQDQSQGQSQAPAVPGTEATWRACPDVPRALVGRAATGMTYECASVAVPRNWAEPTQGETFNVAMIRIRSSEQKDRIGSLLLNPGGPGASGIETAVYLSFGPRLGGLPLEVTNQFDIVGFDPRGVGKSDPVKCVSDADQDASFAVAPDPVTQAEFDQITDLNKRIGDGCGRKYGDELPLFSTEQAAHDMDAIRAAVGDEKTTYLGYSYGTLLGATYAQLYPKKIRALVLDGAVDPKQGYVARAETQAKGFERAFTNFTTWCAATTRSCPIAPDARGVINDVLAKAKVSPVAGKDGRDATPGWIFVGLVSSLYTEAGWPALAKAIDSLQAGNAEGIFDLADSYARRQPDGSYTNLFDANTAVNCADADEVPSAQEVRKLQGEWRTKYPLFGAPLAIGLLPCVYWPAKRDPYPAGPAVGSPPILVVGTTGDPATPYENTAQLAGMLGTGQVLTWEGEGHTAYPNTPCITTAVDAYLTDLTVPRAGLRCPAR